MRGGRGGRDMQLHKYFFVINRKFEKILIGLNSKHYTLVRFYINTNLLCKRARTTFNMYCI